MRTGAINLSLEKTVSKSRLNRYLIEMAGDLDSALALYEYNLQVSEAFYASLQSLEICLRNTLDSCMVSTYGVDWLLSDTVGLSYDAQKEVLAAYRELGDDENLPSGAIIAQLKFAFWVGLLAPKSLVCLSVGTVRRASRDSRRGLSRT